MLTALLFHASTTAPHQRVQSRRNSKGMRLPETCRIHVTHHDAEVRYANVHGFCWM